MSRDKGSARLTVDFGDLALLFVASTTGNENAINFPLGTKPNYTDLQQLSFDNAGEEAAGLGGDGTPSIQRPTPRYPTSRS